MPIIAPSFLASDFLHLAEQCEIINNSSAEWVHLDVMDGRFVPNISFGVPVIKPVCLATPGKHHDVHLMIEEPEKYVEDFKNAGANSITVHYEACRHLHRNIEQIKKLGINAGVALNPHTPVALLQDVLQYIDLVLIMSVNPGFGGQQFIEHSIERIKELRRMIDEKNYTAHYRSGWWHYPGQCRNNNKRRRRCAGCRQQHFSYKGYCRYNQAV